MAFVPVFSGTLNFIHYQLYIEYLYIYLALFQIFIHLPCYLPKNIYIHKLSIVVNIHNVLCYIYVINVYAFMHLTQCVMAIIDILILCQSLLFHLRYILMYLLM